VTLESNGFGNAGVLELGQADLSRWGIDDWPVATVSAAHKILSLSEHRTRDPAQSGIGL